MYGLDLQTLQLLGLRGVIQECEVVSCHPVYYIDCYTSKIALATSAIEKGNQSNFLGLSLMAARLCPCISY